MANKYIPDLPSWPLTTPVPANAVLVAYMPDLDAEYQLLPEQVGGTASTAGSVSAAAVLALTNVAASAAAGVQVSVVGGQLVFAAQSSSAPGQVGVVALAPGNAQMGLSFALVPGATSYAARYRTVGGSFVDGAAGTGSPLTITGLANGTPYDFIVTPSNNAGTGLSSGPVRGTPVMGAPTPAPTGANQLPTALAGSNATIQLPTSQLALFGGGTDPDGTISAYAWRQVTGPLSVGGMPAAVQNPVVTGLTTAGTYQFGLITTDNAGGRSAESFVLVTVQAAADPGTTPNSYTEPGYAVADYFA